MRKLLLHTIALLPLARRRRLCPSFRRRPRPTRQLRRNHHRPDSPGTPQDANNGGAKTLDHGLGRPASSIPSRNRLLSRHRREPVPARPQGDQRTAQWRLDAPQLKCVAAAGAGRGRRFVRAIARGCAARPRRPAVPRQRRDHPREHQRLRPDPGHAFDQPRVAADRRATRAIRLSHRRHRRYHDRHRHERNGRQHRHDRRLVRHAQPGAHLVRQPGSPELVLHRQLPQGRPGHRKPNRRTQRDPRPYRPGQDLRRRLLPAQRQHPSELHVRHDRQPLPDTGQPEPDAGLRARQRSCQLQFRAISTSASARSTRFGVLALQGSFGNTDYQVSFNQRFTSIGFTSPTRSAT